MKRVIFALAAAAILFLGGCSAVVGDKAVENIATVFALPFSFSGSLSLDGMERDVGITATKSAQGLVLELTSPEELAGLRLEFDEDITHLGYRELLINLSEGDIPQQSVFVELKNVLASPLPDGGAMESAGNEIIFSGQAEMTPYKMAWSGDGSALTRIELPSAGAVIVIENFDQIP